MSVLGIKFVSLLVLNLSVLGIKFVSTFFWILAYLCEITSGKRRKDSLKDEYIYTRARLQTWTNLLNVHISRALFFFKFLIFLLFFIKNFFQKKKKKDRDLIRLFYLSNSLSELRFIFSSKSDIAESRSISSNSLNPTSAESNSRRGSLSVSVRT